MSEGPDDAPPSTIGPWPIQEWVARVLDRPTHATSTGEFLARSAGALHAGMGLHGDRTEHLLVELATDDAMVVRLAHQPNLFPYEQIIAQTVYLVDAAAALTAAGRRVVPMVFVVDYDVCDDERIMSARAFDPSLSDQVRRFALRVSKVKEVPAYLGSAPDCVTRAALADGLAKLAKAHGCAPQHLLEHSGVARPAQSLADFNLYAWMDLVIGLWNLPLLFVRLSDVAPAFESERRALADQVAQILGQDQAQHLWNICRLCNKRIALGSHCCGAADYHAESLPRVLIDDLSDYAIYGVSGGTAYYRAEEHLAPAHRIGLQLGFELPPEACWRLSPEAFRLRPSFAAATTAKAKEMLENGHNSLLEHILDRDRAMAALAVMRDALQVFVV